MLLVDSPERRAGRAGASGRFDSCHAHGIKKETDMSISVKNIRKEFAAKGVFYTLPELAMKMKSFVDIDTDEVYDPTCGDGGLLKVFPDTVRKYGQEIDPGQAQLARDTLANAEIATGDTLAAPAFTGRRFRLIMANPPFSIAWDNSAAARDERFAGCPAIPPKSKADFAFLLHIWHMLADGGEAVVLNFPGILYRGNSEGVIRRWMVEQGMIAKVVRIPKNSFVDTSIETALLVLRKGRTARGVVFRDEETGKERTVETEEIRSNNSNLSVNCYIQPDEPERAVVDPYSMEVETQDAALRRIKAELDFSAAVAELEGWGLYQRLIGKLQRLVQDEKDRMHISGDTA